MNANVVDINDAALAHEAASIEVPQDAAPTAPADGGEEISAQAGMDLSLEQIQAKAVHWKGGADFLVNFLCDTVAPAWGVPQEQREKLASQGALALAAWFPDDAIPLKYLLLLGVGTAAWEIVTAQRERHGGKLPPLRSAQASKPSGNTSAPAQPAASAETSGASGGATTSH
jgi:hypothetical protein